MSSSPTTNRPAACAVAGDAARRSYDGPGRAAAIATATPSGAPAPARPIPPPPAPPLRAAAGVSLPGRQPRRPGGFHGSSPGGGRSRFCGRRGVSRAANPNSPRRARRWRGTTRAEPTTSDALGARLARDGRDEDTLARLEATS